MKGTKKGPPFPEIGTTKGPVFIRTGAFPDYEESGIIGFPIPRTVVELLTIFYTLPPKSGFSDFRIINANLCENQIFPRHAVFGKS